MDKKKKYTFVIAIVMSGFMLFPSASSAETVAEYHSNGQIGFFGKYVYPKKEEKSDVVIPERQQEKRKYFQDSLPITKIPQTGGKTNPSPLILGLVFTLASILLTLKYKKMQIKERN